MFMLRDNLNSVSLTSLLMPEEFGSSYLKLLLDQW
jgi:hypothetical protein